MHSTSAKFLQIAKLQYQKGDFLVALHSFVECEVASLTEQNLTDWIDGVRLQMQCLNELDRFTEATPLFEKVIKFCEATKEPKLLARGHATMGFYLLQKNQVPEAQSFLTLAINEATLAQDYETLARALLFDIFLTSLPDQAKWDQSLRSLDKMDLLINTKGLEDILITGLFLRAHIATQRKSFEQASTYLWRAYEMAQNHGHHLLIPNLLLQLGQIYREMGQTDQSQIFFDLSLRGIDPLRHPRQFRRITQIVNPLASRSNLQHDFVVRESTGLIQEKQRGCIDFKNQHVLLDMALLFLKGQGERFTKENLTESVWKQAYNPSQHDNLIYVSIKRLRALLEPDPENPRYILRDRRGYYFSPNCSVSFETPQETRT
jgi:tetratricopeptide (TPR) repeat protein